MTKVKPLLAIINSQFWKSWTGPFFAFGFPMIFVGLLGGLLGYDQVLSGCFLIPITAIALTVMPASIFEFKKSTLLKRIGVTPIKPWMFLATLFVFYVLVMLFAVVWTLVFSLLIFGIKYWDQGREIVPAFISENILISRPAILAPSFKEILMTVNWGGFLYGILNAIIVSCAIGLLLVSISKSTNAITTFGTIILITSQFLAAQVLPLSMVYGNSIFRYITYLTPFKFSTGVVLESWNGSWDGIALQNGFLVLDFIESNPFDIYSPFISFDGGLIQNAGYKGFVVFNEWEKALNLSMSYVWFGIFMGLCLKTFKWSVRG